MIVYPIAPALAATRELTTSARPGSPVAPETARRPRSVRLVVAGALERAACLQLRAAGRLRPTTQHG